MKPLELNAENIYPFIDGNDYSELMDMAWGLQKRLEVGQVPGGEFNGWVNQPSETDPALLEEIISHSEKIKQTSEVLIVIGVGGSYAGTKAAIDFVHTDKDQKATKILFAGHNISSDYLSSLIEEIKDKDCHINIISKSGSTLEPMVAFSIIKEELKKKYGADNLTDRITVTTDSKEGALKKLAAAKGYKTFDIPSNIGGRFSVLTPCGLLPMAVAGIDIKEVIRGALEAENDSKEVVKSPAHQYGVLRTVLYNRHNEGKAKRIELLGLWHYSLQGLGSWWTQLAGESMNKDEKGIFPATADFSSDLHSIGQVIQDGEKHLFETFIKIENSPNSITVPDAMKDDLEGIFSNLVGKTLEDINEKIHKSTEYAHLEGTVPNMTITLKDLSPYTLGYLFYFFQMGITVSCLLLDVNPFDQPGVEKYKKHMKELLK